MSATLNLIRAFNALYIKNETVGALLPEYAPANSPIIKRWTFPGVKDKGGSLGPNKLEDKDESIPEFISMPDPGVIENCIGFHWYELMYNIQFPPVTTATTQNKDTWLNSKYPPYHFIFAYLIENSRIVPIFERIILKFMTGEDLGHPSEFTSHWIRNTQSLFYKDFNIPNFRSINSAILPNVDANRRNAYYRMFGLELNHGNQDNSAVNFVKPVHANLSFVPLLENLLREIWQGIVNQRNTSGANTTDSVALTDMFILLKDCLLSRRNSERNLDKYETSNLSKEEFFSVIMMEWFYQVIATNTDLVKELNAEAGSADERLAKIGKHVGIAPHSKTRDLFVLAPKLAIFLRLIEEGYFNDSDNVMALLNPKDKESFGADISLIITLWQKTTGRNLKQVPNSPYQVNTQRASQTVLLK